MLKRNVEAELAKKYGETEALLYMFDLSRELRAEDLEAKGDFAEFAAHRILEPEYKRRVARRANALVKKHRKHFPTVAQVIDDLEHRVRDGAR